jgi:signal transduction histidine kinase
MLEWIGLALMVLLSALAALAYSRLRAARKDVTRLQAENARLEQQSGQNDQVEQVRKEFLQMIGHDVRTPLTSVQTVLAMLAKGSYGEIPEKAKERVAQARQSLTYVVGLINQLFEMETLATHQDAALTLAYQQKDLRDTLAQSLEIVQPYAELKHITLQVEEDADVVVDADHQRISQVIVNLVSNAIKHAPESSRIRISLSRSDDSVHMRIRDEGPGLERELRTQAFDRFTQFGNRDGGMGLGLAICKAIVEAHEGDIGFETQFGQGCCIWFRLPLTRAHAAAPNS